MYAEIREAVRFLSCFLYEKLPRRKVSLFVEELANFLLLKWESHWHKDDPLKESEYRCIRVNVHGQTESLLSVAASTVGVELDEILQYLPTELTMWVNPGGVSYKVGEAGVVCVLYDGVQTLNQTTEGENELTLSMSRSEGTNWVVRDSGRAPPHFQVTSPHDVQFTVGTFAATRFGSSKQKTNLAALKQIQWKARAAAVERSVVGGERGAEKMGVGVPSPQSMVPHHLSSSLGLPFAPMQPRVGHQDAFRHPSLYAPAWPGYVK